MSSDTSPKRSRTVERIRARDHPTGHALILIELSGEPEYRAQYWRCRACGDEHIRPDDFESVCSGMRPETVAMDGGHLDDVDQTQPQPSTELSVDFLTFGPGYRVHEPDGDSYVVDIEARSCRCEDNKHPDEDCDHLRRADQAIEKRELPGPNGRYLP